MNSLFTLELLIAVVLIVGLVAGLAFFLFAGRRGEEALEGANAEGAGAEGSEPPGAAAGPREPRRDFYLSTGLETGEMRIRLYSLDDYEKEFGGDAGAVGEGRFVGALKAFRSFEDDWYDYPPPRAADALQLAPEDYEVDGERGVLLLKRLPPGLPSSARDVL